MNFGKILEQLKSPSLRAYRKGWNAIELGKECYIYLEPAKTISNNVI